MSADSDRTIRLLLPQAVRQVPVDLTVVVCFAIATCGVVLTPVLRQSSLSFVAVVFVLFVPGYAVVAALFPRALDADVRDTDVSKTARVTSARRVGAIGAVERIALSVALSVAALAFFSLGFEFTRWGIRVVPVVVTLAAFAVGAAAVAAYRRKSLPAEERLGTSLERWAATVRLDAFESAGRTERLLNVVLVVSLLLATASVVYAVAVPRDGQAFTEFYLLSENETGDLVAAGYPATFTPNQTNSVHVGITNHEHRRMEYVVVAIVQRVTVENGSMEVHEQRELMRTRTIVSANETWMRELNVTPSLEGDRLRLVLLLYRGDAPSNVSTETAYRQLRLVENVTVSKNTVDGQLTTPAVYPKTISSDSAERRLPTDVISRPRKSGRPS